MHFARIAVVLVVCSLLVFAQTERGNVTGVVTDPTGASVAGAELTVTNPSTNAATKAVSTATGEYNVPNLSPGVYRIEITAPGFKRFVLQNVVVAAASTVRLDAQLQLGAVSEQVEVSAALATIQTDNAKVSQQVQNKLVDELPLVVGGAMRSPFNLVAVAAEARGRGQGLSLGGGQVAAWDATLDGYSVGTNRSGDTDEAALNTPSVESLTEFTVDTNGFKAEYGQSGGGTLTFASKSGANQFHGSAYDFLRNDKMDAKGFFPKTRSVYRQNDFGFTAGGPVWIPKLYDGRNKTFFFVSYEGFRNRVGANDTFFSVPTPEMYRGDFSNWVDQNNRLITIYDPGTTTPNPSGSGFTRAAFQNNQIPAARFSRIASAIAAYGQNVKPNLGVPGTSSYVRNNYIVTSGTDITPTDKYSVKGDQIIGSKHRVSFLWNLTDFDRHPGAGGPPGLPLPLWSGQIQAWDTEAFRAAHDWTISSNMVNHFSWAKNFFMKNSYSGNVDQNWKDKFCIPNVIDCNQNFPVISFTEFATWSSTSYNGTRQPGWGIKDDLSYIHGSHSLKFGFQHQNQNADGFGQQNIAGAAGFSFLGTSIPGQTSFPASGGSSFASFLLGDAHSGSTETIRAVTQNYPYFGFYAQDDWRLTRKLTLNIGLRYDFTLPPTNKKDEYSDFNPTRPNPGADGYPGALWFAGFGPGRENTRSLVPGWYKGWGPRLGLAYTPDNKTTFRAAFSRSFSRVTAVQGSGHYAGFIGNYSFSNTSQGVQPTFKLDQGLPPYNLPPSIDPAFANGIDVDYWNGQDMTRAPENLSWTFTIQRQVAVNTVIEAGYNANLGVHMQSGLLRMNQAPSAVWDRLVAQFGASQAVSLLNSDINSTAARNAGFTLPYPSFATQRARTVAQSLRPYPQYQNISTGPQNGDKSGHASYHALLLKADRRFSRGLTFQWNYVLSKLLTDSDTYFANSATAAMDHYNRGLEKSIGQYDQTHVFKFSTLYDLPFGRGQKWLSGGFLSQVLGGWRIAAIQVYNSGQPIALQRNNPLPLFNGITRPLIDRYDNWRGPIAGDEFDPNVDRFLKPANQFPAQPVGFGAATRYNPKLRGFWGKSENISLAKTFRIKEGLRVDLRGEAFNIFNRVVFGAGNTNLNSGTFGQVTNQVNDPRQMQVGLKIYW